MPRRTNTFQEVVAVVYGQFAEDADLEEAALLRNRLTGEDREVDVVVRSRAAGHETIVAVEAVGRRRRVSVDWVEQMAGKHRNLPTDKVVLVSEGGFSKQALALARAEQMVPVTPQTIRVAGTSGCIVGALDYVVVKKFDAKLKQARVWAERPGEDTRLLEASSDFDLWPPGGRPDNALNVVLRYLLETRQPQVMDQLDQVEAGEAQSCLVFVGPDWMVPHGRDKKPVYVIHGRGSDRRVYRVDRLVAVAEVRAEVCDVSLTHREFDELEMSTAYGDATVDRDRALLVATRGGDDERLSVRFRGALRSRDLSPPPPDTWGLLVAQYPDR